MSLPPVDVVSNPSRANEWWLRYVPSPGSSCREYEAEGAREKVPNRRMSVAGGPIIGRSKRMCGEKVRPAIGCFISHRFSCHKSCRWRSSSPTGIVRRTLRACFSSSKSYDSVDTSSSSSSSKFPTHLACCSALHCPTVCPFSSLTLFSTQTHILSRSSCALCHEHQYPLSQLLVTFVLSTGKCIWLPALSLPAFIRGLFSNESV